MKINRLILIGAIVSATMLHHVPSFCEETPSAPAVFPIVAWCDFNSTDDMTSDRFRSLASGGFTHVISDFRGRDIDFYESYFKAMSETGIKAIVPVPWTDDKDTDMSFMNRMISYPEVDMLSLGLEPTMNLNGKHGPDNHNVYLRFRREWLRALDKPVNTVINCLPPTSADDVYAGRYGVDGYSNYLSTFEGFSDTKHVGCLYLPFMKIADELSSCDGELILTPGFESSLENAYNSMYDSSIWPIFLASEYRLKLETPGFYPTPTDGQLRYQTSLALAHGARGMQFFAVAPLDDDFRSFANPPMNEEGHTGNAWKVISEINGRMQSMAEIFLNRTKSAFLPMRDVLPEGKTFLDNPPAPFTSLEGGKAGFTVAIFDVGTRHFLMAVNRDYENAQTLRIKKPSSVRLVNGRGVFTRDNHITYDIKSGDFILFTWTDSDDGSQDDDSADKE